MTTPSFDVHDVVEMQLVLSDATVLPVRAEIGFRASDPYTVHATFVGPHSASTWLIGRELLVEGLDATVDAPAGTGDVRVWRDEDPMFVLIALSGVEGSALLASPAGPLEFFAKATNAVVPVGAEGESMESEISTLIAQLLTT